MKKTLFIVLGILMFAAPVFALTTFQVIQGGTGATTFGVGLCLKGNGTSAITAGPCSSGGAGTGTVSTSTALVSGQVDFSTGVNTIGNDSTFLFDTTGKLLTIQDLLATSSSTLQAFTFTIATGTSATTTSFFSTTASSSNLFSANIQGAGLSTCTGASQGLHWTGGLFSCLTLSGFASSTLLGDTNTFSGGNVFGNATTTTLSSTKASTTSLWISGTKSALLVTDSSGAVSGYGGASACSANNFVTTISALGGTTCGTASISGINLGSNLANLTATDATLTFSGTYNGGTARTIGLNLANPNTWTGLQQFQGQASTTQLSVYNLASFGATATSTFNSTGDLLVVGSTTLQNFTFGNATGTSATTTNFFSTTASTSNLYLATGACSGANALNVTAGKVTCGAVSGSGSASSTLLTDNNNFTGLNVVANLTSTRATTTTSLYIPASANPTIQTGIAGHMAIDTTAASTSLRFSDGTAERVLFTTQDRSFAFASSTLAYSGAYGASGTTTLLLMNPYRPTTLVSFYCKTDQGTAHVAFGTGSATTTDANCSTTGVRVNPGSNNTWIMSQDLKIDIGRQSGTPSYITVTATTRQDAD